MPVTGGRQTAAALNRIPQRARAEIELAIEQIADQILADMKQFAPRDTGQLATALTRVLENDGLKARVGLPTELLANDYFYARFIELGTKGGEVQFRRAGSSKRHTMTVPARPARPFMEPALNINRDDLINAIRAALTRATD